MTSQELMIGDWVRQKYSGLTFKVGSIITPYIRVANMAGQFEENTIEPIPLTAEILEKNGFEKDARNESYYKWNWYILQDNVSYDMETGIVRLFKASDLTFCHPIGYVHELQHALRLCEIDKEIVL